MLDFASGSGLVAIAAAKAGARRVVAAEIDAFAIAAIGLNAAANSVAIDTLDTDCLGRFDMPAEIVLAGDIFYDRDIAGRVLAWLEGWRERGVEALVGDPGRTYLPRDRLECLVDLRGAGVTRPRGPGDQALQRVAAALLELQPAARHLEQHDAGRDGEVQAVGLARASGS